VLRKEDDILEKEDILLQDVGELKAMVMKLSGDIADQQLTEKERKMRHDALKKLQVSSAAVQILEVKLGMGGFGQVYLGHYESNEVAVKCISQSAGQKHVLEAAEDELLVMHYLGSHPNLLVVYGYYMESLTSGSVYLLLEYAPYGSLSEMLYDTEHFPILPTQLLLGWARDLASALAFIHSRNVKHRDVKAENVLVFGKFRVKLCDFGLAKKQASSTSKSSAGTLAFQAPEVRQCQGSGYASDVFSWALTVYQMVLRKIPSPYSSTTVLLEELIATVSKDSTLSKVVELEAVLQYKLKALLCRCCAVQADLRPTSAMVKSEVGEVLAMLGGDLRSARAYDQIEEKAKELEKARCAFVDALSSETSPVPSSATATTSTNSPPSSNVSSNMTDQATAERGNIWT
jgi:serine/threonine protein kinase